ncbi:uncharacterized protein LOC129600289 [Paramacrobiotus metropolitanus]|uniref:uncharacterized protein LOC129600289 n=1 Tax=Paramacrobiotus metropolitanus TaxID=2943436 RepID=UPI00244638A8|nr:uncharacterized protein LOC129600289 [Paramacrobiotus metropolitanus]
MNGTSRYLRKLFSGSRELNYGNTVLVQRDNDQWWLGYVQDVDGPNFYVDFDASSISPQWIHSSRLWPHHFISTNRHLEGSTVQIALRRTCVDPMVFLPGTVVNDNISPFYHVRLTGHSPDEIQGEHIVHHNHCVLKLPMPEHKKSFFERAARFLYRKHVTSEDEKSLEDEKSFFERTAGFLYRKYVIRFSQAQALSNVDFIPHLLVRGCRWILGRGESSCDGNCFFTRSVWVDELRYYCNNSGHDASYTIGIGCRVFVRVGLDAVTFVCAEMRNFEKGVSVSWDEEALRKVCDGYLTLALKAQPVDKDTTSWHALMEGMEEMSIGELPHPIIAFVLLYLDEHSQLRMSRVCALWRLLSREPVNHRHILFDLCTNCERQPQDLPERHVNDYLYNCVADEYAQYLAYTLVASLQRAISVRTQTLAMTEDGNHLHEGFDLASRMKMTAAVLASKGVRVPTIIIKNSRNASARAYDFFLEIERSLQTGLLVCHGLPKVMAVCEHLVLANFTFSHFITRAANYLLEYGGDPPLPDSERKLLRWYDRDIDPCPITIPYLGFSSVLTASDHIRIVIAALNDQCPAVSQRVIEKVKAIHARWVRTLAYPDQWNSIAVFLYFFNHLRPGDAPKEWDTMDLRQLDIAAQSPITFAALDGCFDDDDDDKDDDDDDEEEDEDDDGNE